jgi:Domain of unknown function DUF29
MTSTEDAGMSEYDTDILTWSERQASLLRRLSAEAEGSSNGLDWPHIIEEIEAVGRGELRAVESLLFQMFVHVLKAEAWPDSASVSHWHGEARGFHARARRICTPSMAQRIDLNGLYSDALQALPDRMDGQAPLPVPPTCPLTLDAPFGTE